MTLLPQRRATCPLCCGPLIQKSLDDHGDNHITIVMCAFCGDEFYYVPWSQQNEPSETWPAENISGCGHPHATPCITMLTAEQYERYRKVLAIITEQRLRKNDPNVGGSIERSIRARCGRNIAPFKKEGTALYASRSAEIVPPVPPVGVNTKNKPKTILAAVFRTVSHWVTACVRRTNCSNGSDFEPKGRFGQAIF
jgi:hypothetical protein